MAPDRVRNDWRFAATGASLATLLSASPALAQGISTGNVMGAAPVAIALGAGAFALIAVALVRRIIKDNRAAQRRSAEQVSGLRARVDEYEALLSGSREIIVLWTNPGEGPRFLGQASALLPPGRRAEAVLDFGSWLPDADADRLARAIEALRVGGRGFQLALTATDGRAVRASGSLLGDGAALRLRPAAPSTSSDSPAVPALVAPAVEQQPAHDQATARTVLASLGKPAFLRDGAGRLVFANAPYHDLARALGRKTSENQPAELLENGLLQRNRAVLGDLRKPQTTMVTLGELGDFEVVDFPVNGGSAGYLNPKADSAPRDSGLSHMSAIIDALASPIAIFGPNRELVQSNRAYRELWDLDPNWLKLGMDERAILDKLRTDGKLPNEPDYQGWRNRHLQSYQLRTPQELEPWHLPDGRTVQVIAAPAGPKGGVIYVFEDITDQLNLKSQHKALLDVQRSTLNSLSEAVAVFGTNGRLTLSNPKLSTLWKLPANLLADNPHIDQIADAAAKALPEDGATIWRDLKRSIIDLNPTRSDRQGRITRMDGKLIDYAVVRLPDGQTMMTFLDVTESANYQRVLKERNDALITADRLKDAFVQNVSYELRSPLTNIIGFADLLASGVAGELNEKQYGYTNFIRASSATLGVLIDNILDLATVDAGIAELQPEQQDVAALVEKARAGLIATFPAVDGQPSLNLKVVIEPDLPVFVADGTRIVNVLYNLLSNAARFSEPGGEVKLTVSGRTGRMQFIVEDEGAPMTEEMRLALLDRDDALTGTARQRGAGLGLAIVRAFVNMHGGTIGIERREPRGTRVIVSLPSDVAMAGAAE